jgi:hypothetical protein
MAQSAVAAIRTGCNMLAEGTAIIKDAKSTVEKAVSDGKAIYQEVTGLWSWIQGLFANKKQTPIVSVIKENKPETKKPTVAKKVVKEEELSYEEFQARQVHEICEHLKVYFEAIRALKIHCRELEQESLTTEKVADSAIDRIEIEWQMKQLATQVKEAMIYTPERLGLQALYSRFLEMYDQILEEQEFARAVKAKKERDAKWQRELLRNHRIDRAMVMLGVTLVMMWIWGLLLSLGWLVRTHAGLSSQL